MLCPTSVLCGSSAALRGQPLQQQQQQQQQRGPGAVQRLPARLRVTRATLEADSPASSSGSDKKGPAPQEQPEQPTAPAQRSAPDGLSHRVNLIPESKWDNGIPPVMGAHLMASGVISPLSTSKTIGREPDAFRFYYPTASPDTTVLQFVSPSAVAKGLAELLADASARAVADRGAFTVALSGGSLVDALAALADRRDVEFDKWHVFWVDERNVPLDSPDSNHAAASNFLDRAGVPAPQVHAIKPGMSVADAATNYAGRMLDLPESVLPRNEQGLPVIDAVLLGVGPDGHVASLFPNRAALADQTGAWVLPVANSPKPPPQRITLSLHAINAAAEVVFVACGAGKAEVVQRVLEVQALPGALPAQMVRPDSGRVTWLLDGQAAAGLHVGEWQNSKAFPRSKLPGGK